VLVVIYVDQDLNNQPLHYLRQVLSALQDLIAKVVLHFNARLEHISQIWVHQNVYLAPLDAYVMNLE